MLEIEQKTNYCAVCAACVCGEVGETRKYGIFKQVFRALRKRYWTSLH